MYNAWAASQLKKAIEVKKLRQPVARISSFMISKRDYLVQDRNDQLDRAIRYLEANLDKALNLEEISAVACFSKYHFHRMFSAYTGLSVFEYIRHLRLKRAAYSLAFDGTKSVTTIALDAGFETLESFSRAFKAAVGQAPRHFRCHPDWSLWHEPLNNVRKKDYSMHDVNIKKFPETSIALLEHRGSPTLINDSVEPFIAWRKQYGLSPDKARTFNIFYNDPETIAVDDYRLGICCAVKMRIDKNDLGVVGARIPNLTCAFMRHGGSWDHLGAAIHALYYDWLPKSGYRPGQHPLFVERVNLFPQTPEHALITDIYLPIDA